MSRNRNEAQFDQYREWQWAKHMALGDYIVPWSMKVGSSAPAIFVADLFAGAGTYDDVVTGRKTDGSPLIFARRAQKYMEERPGKRMHVICTERNRKNFKTLQARLAGFVPEYVTLRSGNFARHQDAIVAQMSGAPALILLDPIGLKSISAETCRPLLHRPEKTDVFIILHFRVLHRTAGWLLDTGHADPSISGSDIAAAGFDAVFDTPAGGTSRARPTFPAPSVSVATSTSTSRPCSVTGIGGSARSPCGRSTARRSNTGSCRPRTTSTGLS